jgi:DNA-directed RNA polymerase alpha subunit
MQLNKNRKICEFGHEYYKISVCPTCPICEKNRKPKDYFLSLLAAPARRALESLNIKSIEELSQYTEKEILTLHGMGKSSIPILKEQLAKDGLSFKK